MQLDLFYDRLCLKKSHGDVGGAGSYSVKILSDDFTSCDEVDNNVAQEVDLMIDIVLCGCLG